MPFSLVVAVFSAIAFTTCIYFRHFLVTRRLENLSREHNCQPIHRCKSFLPFAIDRKIKLLFSKGNFLDKVEKNYHRQGKWIYSTDSIIDTSIFAADPQIAQAILATNFKDWGLGKSRLRSIGPLLGETIVSVDGNAWSQMRALLRPQFIKDQISDLDVIERHVQRLFEELSSDEKGWTTGDNLPPLIQRFTLDAATEAFFGESVNSQLGQKDGNGSEPIAFERQFDFASARTSSRFKAGPFYWLIDGPRFRKACATWHEYGDRIV